MRPFEYLRPAGIDDALAWLAQDARPLAGGTDLLTLMKADIEAPRRLIDIKRLPELDGSLTRRADGLTIGALATLADLERHSAVVEEYAALAQAAAFAATVQLRNAATLGGNLLQQPRCWYFRNPHLGCWRRGGAECPAWNGENRLHALFGGGPCHAVHPSDPAAALMALDAIVVLRGPRGPREVPLEELFVLPTEEHRREVRIAADELVTHVRLPPAAGRSIYLKAMDRKRWAFALASVAARAQVVDGRVRQARIVLGGVAPVPWRVPAAEDALVAGEAPDRVAECALEGAMALRHNGYKVPLARALVRRAVEGLLRGAEG